MRFVIISLLLIFSITFVFGDWFSFFSKSNEIKNNTITSITTKSKDIKINRSSVFQPFAPVKRHENSSITPVKHPYDTLFYRKANDHISRVGNITKLIFLGDGLLYRVVRNISIWDPLLTKYGAISLAGPGDRTENILYRLQSGFLKNITSNPLVVIVVGGSNAAVGDSAQSIYLGVTSVVQAVKKDLTDSNIILLGLLPKPKQNNNILHQLVNEKLNHTYLINEFSNHHVTFVDISSKFYLSNNSIDNSLYSNDFNHPNARGYEIILTELNKCFYQLPVLSKEVANRLHHHNHHVRTFNKVNISDKILSFNRTNRFNSRFNYTSRSIGKIISDNLKNNTAITV